MTRVFIDGNQGTTGLRISDRLGSRNDITLLILPEADRKNLNARRDLANSADIVFLCLPDAASKEIAAEITNPKTTVIDASTAHRTNPAWGYGFPELSEAHRARIAAGGKIAVPGCHASGFVSLVYPLVAGGIAAADYPFVCHSVTGYSGGGKSMIAAYGDAERPTEYDSPRQYGIAQAHKHLPEMQVICGLADKPCFSPIVADFYAGMAVSIPLSARL
ncbi:MAG: N-acetyl-gamma-glutamyl-phosphate reductase, partial [Clostridia bacterium]|nr:N-acetyl-gamma-glutamyl-phosphate reductase [Clostridia bacterium]